MRRAAVRVGVLKKEQDKVPELIRLLHDTDAEVGRAAHTALKDLSGQDFGANAEADWLAWWKARQASSK